MTEMPPKTAMYAHQEREFRDHRDDAARALLWQMRTGKTKAVIDCAAWLHLNRRLTGVIVLAPNGVHENWVRREIPAHCPVPFLTVAWRSDHKKNALFKDSVQYILPSHPQRLVFFTFNNEALRTEAVQIALRKFIQSRHRYGERVMLVVDESHNYGTPGSRRTKLARGLARKCDYRRILSGTATGNRPLSLYSQFQILDEGSLGFDRYDEFKTRYGVFSKTYARGRHFDELDGYQNLDELQERVSCFASVVLREDCEDLPPVTHSRRYFHLTGWQKEAYDSMRRRFVAELEGGGEIEAVDASVRIMRLQQITGNFITSKGDKGFTKVSINRNPRLDTLVEILKEQEGQIVVWCRFRADIELVKERLSQEGITFGEYHGGVNAGDRLSVLANFTTGYVRVFLGQPQAGGSGLDLSEASTIVWYSHTFDVIHRDQATERASKIGKRAGVEIVDIVGADTVDEYIIEVLESKRNVADDLTGSGLRDRLLGMFEGP